MRAKRWKGGKMEGYVKPEIFEISDMMETVGLGSGDLVDDRVTLVWTNHDGGTHSDMWVGIKRGSEDKTGGVLKIQLNAPGRAIVSAGHSSMFSMTFERPDVLRFDFSFSGSQLQYGFNVGDMIFSPGPFDPSTPIEAWKGARGQMGNGVESGSFGWPTETIDSRAVLNTSIPDTKVGQHDIYTGAGNANPYWNIVEFRLW